MLSRAGLAGLWWAGCLAGWIGWAVLYSAVLGLAGPPAVFMPAGEGLCALHVPVGARWRKPGSPLENIPQQKIICLVGCAGLCCAVLCWAVLGRTRLCWAVLGSFGLCLVVLGSAGQSWAVLGSVGQCLASYSHRNTSIFLLSNPYFQKAQNVLYCE